MYNFLVRIIVNILLWFRYSVKIEGLEEIYKKGNNKILFLPNHPALIDPIILMSRLYKKFKLRPMADYDQVNRPFVRGIVKRVNAVILPNLAKTGKSGKETIVEAMSSVVEALKDGDNIIMYPAGHLAHNCYEDIGGSSGVEHIVKEVLNLRIVLIKTTGLWGSSFSYAKGHVPLVARYFKKYILSMLFNLIFFVPRRKVVIKLVEPADFPRSGDRLTINSYLEEFYNKEINKNVYVPYFWWQGYKSKVLPEVEEKKVTGETSHVSKTIKQQVDEFLKELSGVKEIKEENKLSKDLGLDSLSIVELMDWIGEEFGMPQEDMDALQTVADCYLAAIGEVIGKKSTELKPVAAKWFKTYKDKQLEVPDGETIAEVFLKQARKYSNRVIISDQIAGSKTYRDIILAIYALKPEIEKIPSDNIGIMLPATVTATIVYMAVMFTGKTPVMVNWTVGESNIDYSLKQVKVGHVLTAKGLVDKLKGQGFDPGAINVDWVFLEEVAKKINLKKKLTALAKSKLSWKALKKAKISDTAVILFTSGSEANPKAVPLLHKNLLTNVRDFPSIIPFTEKDRILGILPPFHSFGITGTVVMPLLLGLKTVYHANPTESAILGKTIRMYKATVMLSTPTFFDAIVRTSSAKDLESLEVIVSGAEKCPEYAYKALKEACPKVRLCEGYGITECSPAVAANRLDNIRFGTIGHILPSVDYAIVNEDKTERVDKGTRGLLLVRGGSIFSGYIGDHVPSPFVQFESKEWYNTGDLVEEDQDGFITFKGRLKRFIKLGGEMISLPAIEAALQKHYPATDEGPVVAIEATPVEANPEVVLFSTIDVDREKANQVIREEGLSALHNIRKVIKVDEIPVLGTGKTNYRELKGMLS